MVWYLSEPHQAIYDTLTEAKNAATAAADSAQSTVVTTKALGKLVQVGLLTEADGVYERPESLGPADTVGAYVA